MALVHWARTSSRVTPISFCCRSKASAEPAFFLASSQLCSAKALPAALSAAVALAIHELVVDQLLQELPLHLDSLFGFNGAALGRDLRFGANDRLVQFAAPDFQAPASGHQRVAGGAGGDCRREGVGCGRLRRRRKTGSERDSREQENQ